MSESNQMQKYFESIANQTSKAYAASTAARKKGMDPEPRVDVPLAANMAERVAGLVSLAAPNLESAKLTERIRELESMYEQLDWRVGLKIAEEVAQGKFCKFRDNVEAMEVGIRVGFAYLTLGIVAAPLEGFIGLKIKQRKDGGNYLAIYYAGPIRGAGGTAAALSVILSDYVRIVMGLGKYDPTPEEISRYATEINDYHERVTNLQYKPSDEEVKFLAGSIAVEINGDPTEEIEVSNYKDLQRIETNRIRGGICLVLAEGIAQKSPKLWKRLSKWGKDFGLEWEFLNDFLEIQKKIKARSQAKSQSSTITPNYTFIADLVAGRPVLSHPMRNGGFRLRYGRTPISGFSAAGLHPATLSLFNNYIATGTQLKTERPGKAASVTPCDSIEGPIVKLKNGSVARLSETKGIKQILNEVEEILYLGDILFSYGDFSENGHKLVPAGYCEEWWQLDVESKGGKVPTEINFDTVLKLSKDYNTPMHPLYTYFWKSISIAEYAKLTEWFKRARMDYKEDELIKIIIPLMHNEEAKRILELLGVPHNVINNEFVVITGSDAQCIKCCLGESVGEDVLSTVSKAAGFKVMDKAGTFIGARMGRPEKAKMRRMAGSPHILFPVGDEGERMRSFHSALKNEKIWAEFPLFQCQNCNISTIYPTCDCGSRCKKIFYCRECGEDANPSCQHGLKKPFKRLNLDIKKYFEHAAKILREPIPGQIKGVRGTSNSEHVVEHLAKGILRAKHNIYVNKDGTTRYDMTELPVTHFRPKEIGTPIEKLRELGYDYDVYGRPLENNDQTVELRVQDVILPSNENSLDESSKKVLYRVGKFVDDLLEKFYGQPRYYNLKSEEDLIGHLVVGLAPHISAGLIGRIIGFSDTQGCFAHPLWHAGLRRDCDGDECCVMLLMDTLLNFSRQFLPNQRGAKTMDSPLVLTSKLIPSEVDDQSHGLDVAWKYPLELYAAALEYKNPWEVNVEQIKHRLGTEKQYEQFGFTHSISSMNIGIKCSAYKTIPTMGDKLKGQIDLARRIRAVDEADVARLVIEKHFIKDIKGNLRKFSMQQFRCSQCNEKYRRPPLVGMCTVCNGKLLFTISEGSIVKYLQPSLELGKEFNLSPYLLQTLELTKNRIESVFGKEKDRQSGLGQWVAA